MVPVSERWVALALDQLRANIASANQIGNVEGLLARHILYPDSRMGLQWTVDCDDEWMKRFYDPTNLGSVAALAYTVVQTGLFTWRGELEAGMQRATARDPKAAGPAAALHDPAVLIGLCLGARALQDRSNQYTTWCSSVVRDFLALAAGRRVDPMWAYAAQICSTERPSLPLDVNAPLTHRAALDWWYRRVENRPSVIVSNLVALRRSIVEDLLSEPLPQLPGHQAALLWRCLRDAISEVAASTLQTPATISCLLRQFEPSMKRWRWDTEDLQRPIRWPIRGEREVQDILWLMLRPVAPDLEDEDTLPKFGHSTYRADFGIPSLGLLIEAKFARSAADFKAIEKQVLEDLVPYLKSPERYREVLVLIYDDSCSVQNHDTTVRALRSVAGITDVVIVCRPSQLPTAGQQDATIPTKNP
jgi:hypothetical protein